MIFLMNDERWTMNDFGFVYSWTIVSYDSLYEDNSYIIHY